MLSINLVVCVSRVLTPYMLLRDVGVQERHPFGKPVTFSPLLSLASSSSSPLLLASDCLPTSLISRQSFFSLPLSSLDVVDWVRRGQTDTVPDRRAGKRPEGQSGTETYNKKFQDISILSKENIIWSNFKLILSSCSGRQTQIQSYKSWVEKRHNFSFLLFLQESIDKTQSSSTLFINFFHVWVFLLILNFSQAFAQPFRFDPGIRLSDIFVS